MLSFRNIFRIIESRAISVRRLKSGSSQEVKNDAEAALGAESENIDVSEVKKWPDSIQGHLHPSEIPKPIYHKLRVDKQLNPSILTDEYVTLGNHDGSLWRLYDYYKIGEMVKSLPTLDEKIAFVNPHERPWKRDEIRWHREWMRNLHSPRKAYNLPPTPAYFDVLNFYQYITKTIPFNGDLAEYYRDLNLPTGKFEKRVKDSLFSILAEEQVEQVEDLSKKGVDRLLGRILEDAMLSLPEKSKVSTNPRCESFWIRAGFGDLYLKEDIVFQEVKFKEFDRRWAPRLVADHRQKLGELAFTMRDELTVQVRSKTPNKPLTPFFAAKDTSDFFANFELFSPTVYNIYADSDPLWQCPGYEPESEETHRFGKVAFKNVRSLNERSLKWNLEPEEEAELRPQLLEATALSTLFNWNNGQAHCQAFSQYNDLDRPFTSQLILSDGREFSFALHQLNTLAINIQCPGFVNKSVNFSSFKGPFNLFDQLNFEQKSVKHLNSEGTLEEGFNSEVLQFILRSLCV